MRGLIVDDEPSVCLLLSRILSRDFDCEAAEAGNGREALALLARERYDFVLLDLLMPVMGGYETLQSIRRSRTLRNLPVMVMSTVREEARVREAIGLGIGSYMAKPLRPTEVSARLARLIAGLETSATETVEARRCGSLMAGDRVLVVDQDREFRQVVRSVLSPEYSVATASGGAQGLRMAMEHTPGLIILGSQLGALRVPTFLDRLRELPRLGAVPVVATVPAPGHAAPAGADATIARTLDPEVFRSQFRALLHAPVIEGERAPERLGIEGLLVAATQHAMAATLDMPVTEDPAALAATPGDEVAYVPIALTRPACEYRVLLRAAPDTARLLAARALRQTEVDDVAMASTLQASVRTLATRVLSGLRSDGALGELGAPASTCWMEPDRARDGATVAEAGFASADGALQFSVVLRMAPKATASTALPLP